LITGPAPSVAGGWIFTCLAGILADDNAARENAPIPPEAAMSSNDLVAIDGALSTLAELDSRKSFFGGLTFNETADILKVWEETIRRNWNVTKSRLKRELSPRQSRGI
jgi:hypothetical protein